MCIILKEVGRGIGRRVEIKVGFFGRVFLIRSGYLFRSCVEVSVFVAVFMFLGFYGYFYFVRRKGGLRCFDN